MDKNQIKIIILAAGKGTRMKSDLPKVLETAKGKSIIKYLLESIEKSGIGNRPIIVVGYGKEKVMEALGKDYDYVIQEEQKGTGHAVIITQKILENNADHIMVLYGDHPLISPETIKKLKDVHLSSSKKITMATFTVPDFDDWRAVFYKNFSLIPITLSPNSF